jgi:hypothetical protein
MAYRHVTTEELDQYARLGLEDLRQCFSANPAPGAFDRAGLCLQILRQGTSRMSGENNRVATALKVAKAAGIAPEDQRILWAQITGSEPVTPRVERPKQKRT